MKVVIVGARERSSIKKNRSWSGLRGDEIIKQIRGIMKDDSDFMDKLLADLKDKYGGNLCVVTTGCDDGVGAIVKATVLEMSIDFVELKCHFFGSDRARTEYIQFYKARNAFLNEIGDQFHILINDRRVSMMEDLLDRVKQVTPFHSSVRPYYVWDEQRQQIESSVEAIK